MTVRDPVCGMEINPESASSKREHMGHTFYFCSRSCAELFDKDPHRYMTTSATTGFNPERPLARIELPLSGPPSNGHSTHLASALRALPGVGEVKVNTAAGGLEVAYETGKVVGWHCFADLVEWTIQRFLFVRLQKVLEPDSLIRFAGFVI